MTKFTHQNLSMVGAQHFEKACSLVIGSKRIQNKQLIEDESNALQVLKEAFKTYKKAYPGAYPGGQINNDFYLIETDKGFIPAVDRYIYQNNQLERLPVSDVQKLKKRLLSIDDVKSEHIVKLSLPDHEVSKPSDDVTPEKLSQIIAESYFEVCKYNYHFATTAVTDFQCLISKILEHEQYSEPLDHYLDEYLSLQQDDETAKPINNKSEFLYLLALIAARKPEDLLDNDRTQLTLNAGRMNEHDPVNIRLSTLGNDYSFDLKFKNTSKGCELELHQCFEDTELNVYKSCLEGVNLELPITDGVIFQLDIDAAMSPLDFVRKVNNFSIPQGIISEIENLNLEFIFNDAMESKYRTLELINLACASDTIMKNFHMYLVDLLPQSKVQLHPVDTKLLAEKLYPHFPEANWDLIQSTISGELKDNYGRIISRNLENALTSMLDLPPEPSNENSTALQNDTHQTLSL